MQALRHRSSRVLAAVFFAALLLIPLLESGHSHADRDLAKPCTICVVAHHAPAAASPVVAMAMPVGRATHAVVALVAAPASSDHSPISGRAPPRLLSVVEV